ncbi:PAS domain-containing protein [Lichenicoccus roseus]|uniref:PAS domain-containing protein n=1 Tax=Lichenicoccus roseus TaxID=2683649 RepID=A0A5R9J6J4_9PROT|nr:PAS domain-containing protein [Lichenicoccus roseus]TLU72589.1 PAS domain-containing protein [Lichenicoccus roseus]
MLTAPEIRTALTLAMQHSTAPMVLSDPNLPDTPMVAVNAAFARLSGYPVEEIVGRNCRFLQGPRTDPVSPLRIRKCLDAGQGCIEWIVNYRRDGSHFYNLLFISPVRDRQGNLLFFFGNQLDITMGSPTWLNEVLFGSAHVVPALEDEFHALLEGVSVAARTEGLERIVAAAHRLAEISTKLEPGTLDTLRSEQR